MKKTAITAFVFLLVGLGIGYLLFHSVGKSSSETGDSPALSATPTPEDENGAVTVPPYVSEGTVSTDERRDTEVVNLAFSALEFIKMGNYDLLAKMVSPEDGVYFAPYSHLDLSANMHFTSEQVAVFASDKSSYLWGYTDGEGAPIELSPTQYFEKYVFDQDYTAAPIIGRNYIVKSGNSIENVQEVFPDCQFVDFHFPGFDPQVGGMDWCTLRLVFREYEDDYKLVAIIHAQWTI